VLLRHLADVQVEEVSRSGGSVRVMARTTVPSAACPGCGQVSRRVHSRYERWLLDTAIGGCEVVICLVVRRFLCLSPECAKVTFAEQVSGLTSRYARRTPVLTAVLEAVALALGGRAGARLSGRLTAGVSRMTLLRLIRALPDPSVSQSPRVLGVDEFALRKGHSYGTLLVDVETRRPVDILDERSSESFVAWLAARPGAELICRDRAGVYADGGTRGAPDAVQVADRWHLWHNLGETVERAVARHRQQLAAAVTAPAAAHGILLAPETPRPPDPPPRTGRIADRTRARHADVHRLLADGRTLSEIAAGSACPATPSAASPAPPARKSSSSMTAPAAEPASSMSTPPTCANAGIPAALTPSCSGRRSATADTRAAAGRSAATSRVSAETRLFAPHLRPRQRPGP
jgi:transposase